MSELHSSYNYRSTNFDPTKLTINALKSILLHEQVEFAASLKKDNLVALFNQHVKNKPAKPPVKPSSVGIEDMTGTPSSSVKTELLVKSPDITNDNVFQIKKKGTPSTTKKRTEVKAPAPIPNEIPLEGLGIPKALEDLGAPKALTFKEEPYEPPPAKILHRNDSPAPSSEYSKVPFSFAQQPSNAATPYVPYASPFAPSPSASTARPPFSFASPSASKVHFQTDTYGTVPNAFNQGKTENVPKAAVVTPRAANITRRSTETPHDDHDDDADVKVEEDDKAASAEQSKKKNALSAWVRWLFSVLILIIVIAGVGLVGTQLLKIYNSKLPFCDSSQIATLNKGEIDHVGGWHFETCRPCPSAADCSKGIAVCQDKLKSVTSRGECEYDAHKLDLLTKVHHKLAQIKGEFECKWTVTPSVSPKDLLVQLKQLYGKDFDAFNETSFLGLLKINSKEKFTLVKDDNGNNFLEAEDVIIPVFCTIQRTLLLFLWEHVTVVLATTSVLAIATLLLLRYRAQQAKAKKVQSMVAMILSRLQKQAKESRSRGDDPFISVQHIRAQFFKKEPKELWEKVSKEIRADPRVRETQQHVRGDPHLSWEWTAPAVLDSPQ